MDGRKSVGPGSILNRISSNEISISKSVLKTEKAIQPTRNSPPVSDDIPLDRAIESALKQPRERHNLLIFEDKIVRLMKSPKENCLEFPPLSGFHRLLLHRLAIRFGLEHHSVDVSNQIGKYENSCLKSKNHLNRDFCPITLTKTAHCSIPNLLLIDMCQFKSNDSGASTDNSMGLKGKISLMKRDPQIKNQKTHLNKTQRKKQVLTVEEKEKAYEVARARIFGSKVQSKASKINSESENYSAEKSSCDSSVSSNQQTEKPKETWENFNSTERRAKTNLKEETCSENSSVTTCSSNSENLSPNLSIECIENKKNWQNVQNFAGSKNQKAKVVNAGEWLKDGKVKARRREDNTRDPDFQRNSNAYRSSNGNIHARNVPLPSNWGFGHKMMFDNIQSIQPTFRQNIGSLNHPCSNNHFLPQVDRNAYLSQNYPTNFIQDNGYYGINMAAGNVQHNQSNHQDQNHNAGGYMHNMQQHIFPVDTYLLRDFGNKENNGNKLPFDDYTGQIHS
mmetsp:Transcript_1074/g.1622  ORF Transcript_1074/g.1622 Transcript_1074/m.1622 type:complete len:507 (-) Transcript_1074:87-1607(-)